MVYHERRRDIWATSIAILLLTTVLGFIGYAGDTAYKGILSSISDVKSENIAAHQRLWDAFQGSQSKINCIQDQLAKCCKESVYCG